MTFSKFKNKTNVTKKNISIKIRLGGSQTEKITAEQVYNTFIEYQKKFITDNKLDEAWNGSPTFSSFLEEHFPIPKDQFIKITVGGVFAMDNLDDSEIKLLVNMICRMKILQPTVGIGHYIKSSRSFVSDNGNTEKLPQSYNDWLSRFTDIICSGSMLRNRGLESYKAFVSSELQGINIWKVKFKDSDDPPKKFDELLTLMNDSSNNYSKFLNDKDVFRSQTLREMSKKVESYEQSAYLKIIEDPSIIQKSGAGKHNSKKKINLKLKNKKKQIRKKYEKTNKKKKI